MCCDADWKREIVPDHKVIVPQVIDRIRKLTSSLISSTFVISIKRISSLVSSKSIASPRPHSLLLDGNRRGGDEYGRV